MPDIKIPFYSLQEQHSAIREQILKSLTDVYDSNWFLLGDKLQKFESEFASFCGTKYCAGVANGLDAIYLSLKALEVGPGDEVIVPSHTYIATWLAVSMTGATIVPVEPDFATYNINPALIESSITSKTKVIVPVHLYGQACAMDGLVAVAKKHNLFIVEDNAQSQGCEFNGKKTGSFGHINATSFYPGKNLGALGDAGGITTDHEAYAQKITSLRNYGSAIKYHNDDIGINSRLDELQAAMLSVKLTHLMKWNNQRKTVAAQYLELLQSTGDVVLPVTGKGSGHVYHTFVIRTEKRDQLQQHLTDHGIGTVIHYPIAIHNQKAYAHLNFKTGQFPLAEEIAKTCLSLPLWPGMPEHTVNEVASAVKKFYGKK